MADYPDQIQETFQFLNSKLPGQPDIGIILGTGLGGLIKEIRVTETIPYNIIPHFPLSTVETHEGKLIFGELGGKKVLAMQGRFHYYEGYSMKQITFPVRIMAKFGIKNLLISNAAGGMNPLFKRGDLMVIHDHINLLGDNPLIGPNLDEFGPRFPDMSEPYSFELIDKAKEVAMDNKIALKEGVFVALSGPNLETRAEYRFLRNIGADAVGMSTVPENIVAVHCGMKVLGISVITDECFPEALKPVNVQEIIETAKRAEPSLTLIMKEVIARI